MHLFIDITEIHFVRINAVNMEVLLIWFSSKNYDLSLHICQVQLPYIISFVP